MWPRPRRFGLV